MERSTKIVIGVIMLGIVLPCVIIFPLVSQQEKKAQDLAGIRDYKAGRYDAAIQDLSGYLKVHPDTADQGSVADSPQYAQYYLGLALLKQRRYAEAVDVFRTYAQYSAGNEGNYLLGVALFRNGDKTEARVKFEEVIHGEISKSASTHEEHLVTLSEKMIDKVDHSH